MFDRKFVWWPSLDRASSGIQSSAGLGFVFGMLPALGISEPVASEAVGSSAVPFRWRPLQFPVHSTVCRSPTAWQTAQMQEGEGGAEGVGCSPDGGRLPRRAGPGIKRGLPAESPMASLLPSGTVLGD